MISSFTTRPYSFTSSPSPQFGMALLKNVEPISAEVEFLRTLSLLQGDVLPLTSPEEALDNFAEDIPALLKACVLHDSFGDSFPQPLNQDELLHHFAEMLEEKTAGVITTKGMPFAVLAFHLDGKVALATGPDAERIVAQAKKLNKKPEELLLEMRQSKK